MTEPPATGSRPPEPRDEHLAEQLAGQPGEQSRERPNEELDKQLAGQPDGQQRDHPERSEPPPIRGKVLGRQWPLGIVTAGLIGSLVVVMVEDFRPGALLFAAFVLLGAVFRLALPSRRAGLLVLRSRPVDVLVMAVLGLAIAVLAVIVPDIR